MRVKGAIGVVEMARIDDVDALRARFVEEGVFIRPFGKLVYTMPPYVSSSADVATVTGAIVRSLR